MGSDGEGKSPAALQTARRFWAARSLKEKAACGGGAAVVVRRARKRARARRHSRASRALPAARAASHRHALRAATQALVLMKLLVRDHDNWFVLAEIAHFSGSGFLLYKLLRVESCEGACAALARAAAACPAGAGLPCDATRRA